MYYHNDATVPQEVLTSTESVKQQPQQSTNSLELSSSVSMPLIRSIWSNQTTILLSATTLMAGISMLLQPNSDAMVISSLWNWSNNSPSMMDSWTVSVVQGVLATIPLIAMGNAVEHSDNQDASQVNFATTNMVISLFGRRKSVQYPDATSAVMVILLSLAIALSTGLSEELIFRGYLPVALSWLTNNSSIAFLLLGQALFFAMAHISPTSSMGENKVVGGLQFMNGLWYGMVYQLTGGSILSCVIAHLLYDMHVLCETWNVINHQMDYTQKAFHNTNSNEEEVAIQAIQDQTDLNSESLNFAKRFFYAFDSQHKGSLSLCDVQRAISYAFLKDDTIPEPDRVEQAFHQVLYSRSDSSREVTKPTDRLVVSEFLRVLLELKSNQKVVLC
jgi:membrane protease YdiL (CAAX protease family)